MIESSSKLNRRTDFSIPSSNTPASRNKNGLFVELDSFRNDLRKQINDKMKLDSRLPKYEDTRSISPLSVKDQNKENHASIAEKSSAIYNDLLSALKGGSNSHKERQSFSKENLSNRPSSLPEDSKPKVTETKANPLEELSKNLFTTGRSENVSKENLKPNVFGYTQSDKYQKESPLTS